jgi:uridine phosphorylase
MYSFIYLGTCGSPGVDCGKIVVSTEAVLVQRNTNAFRKHNQGKNLPYYLVSEAVQADPALSQLLGECIGKEIGQDQVVSGLCATADSFYSSQGRVLPHFVDHNETVIDDLLKVHPNLKAIEMETSHLLDMADVSQGTIQASACMIVLAQRTTNTFLALSKKEELEKTVGLAVLKTLAQFPLQGTMNDSECVWVTPPALEQQWVKK